MVWLSHWWAQRCNGVRGRKASSGQGGVENELVSWRVMQTRNYKTLGHPRRAAFYLRMTTPIVGMRRKNAGGCYGCCQHFSDPEFRDGRLCTICHKYLSRHRFHCCGAHTVAVSPRIRVPRVGSGRWKVFLKRFPRFAFSESLICAGHDDPDTQAAGSLRPLNDNGEIAS